MDEDTGPELHDQDADDTQPEVVTGSAEDVDEIRHVEAAADVEAAEPWPEPVPVGHAIVQDNVTDPYSHVTRLADGTESVAPGHVKPEDDEDDEVAADPE